MPAFVDQFLQRQRHHVIEQIARDYFYSYHIKNTIAANLIAQELNAKSFYTFESGDIDFLFTFPKQVLLVNYTRC